MEQLHARTSNDHNTVCMFAPCMQMAARMITHPYVLAVLLIGLSLSTVWAAPARGTPEHVNTLTAHEVKEVKASEVNASEVKADDVWYDPNSCMCSDKYPYCSALYSYKCYKSSSSWSYDKSTCYKKCTSNFVAPKTSCVPASDVTVGTQCGVQGGKKSCSGRCCSKDGWCGLGRDYCISMQTAYSYATPCTSSPSPTSQAPPVQTKKPLSVRSPFGFTVSGGGFYTMFLGYAFARAMSQGGVNWEVQPWIEPDGLLMGR